MALDPEDVRRSLGRWGIALPDVESWITGAPRFNAADGLEAAAARLAAYCRQTDALLTRLPAKPRRDADATAAAGTLKDGARQARTRFLRVFAVQIYRLLTNDYRNFVRLETIVADAAEKFPGLLPSADALKQERELAQGDKEGLEADHGIFLSHVLSDRQAGLHLIHAMQRPTGDAERLLGRFLSEGVIDLGRGRVERHGRAGHVLLQNAQYLNAEDDSTLRPMETAVDLVLLDPEIEVGVLRGAAVDHPKYAGRHVFNAGLNLTHLYYGKVSLVEFFLSRELGLIGKLYRGLSGPEFLPDEPEQGIEKPWIAAVEAFAIGGGCQLLLVMDQVLAEQDAFFSLPARKEGFIPGAANLRLARFVGDRLARQAVLYERSFAAASPEGRLLCDELVEPGRMDEAIERAVAAACAAGPIGAAANRRALRLAQEPLDVFRRYMALYAREQAACHMSDELIHNLEQNWSAKSRRLKEA